MSKRWFLLIVTVFLLAAFLMPACGGGEETPTATTTATPTATKEPVTIKVSYTCPSGVSYGVGLDWFGEEFPKRTNGRYKVEVYPLNTIISMQSSVDQLKGRVAEIASVVISLFKEFPIATVTSVPLGKPTPTLELYQKAQDAVWELYNTTPEIQDEFKDLIFLHPFALDPSYLVMKDKEIHKAADFKGVTMGMSGAFGEVIKANGGATVAQTPPMSYENIDKGLIDGCGLNYSMLSDYNIQEIAHVVYELGTGNGYLAWCMNKEAFNEMSAEDQQILRDTIHDAAYDYSCPAMIESAELGHQKAVDANMKIITPTAEEIAQWKIDVQPGIDYWVNLCEAAGIQNPIRFYNSWQEILNRVVQ
jgi:TRAP-type C4-dicarboxylate transport system substrate-binding protein